MTDEETPKYAAGGVIRPGASLPSAYEPFGYPFVEYGDSRDPRHAQPSGILSTPRTITDDEYRRIERRWRWAIKAQGNALRILNPDGSHAGWFGRRPVWWKRAYYRARMFLARWT